MRTIPSEPHGAATPGNRTGYRAALFGVLATAFFLAFLSRYATAVIVPDLEASFGIGAAEIGLLGAVYFWAYAVMQPPAGLLADSVGPRRAVALFLLLAAAGTAAFAAAPGFPAALAARAVGGFGTGIVYVSAARVFSRWFAADQFGPVMGLFAATGNAGGLAAGGPLAAAVGAIGWRESFAVLAALIALSAVAVWLLVRDAPPGAASGTGGPSVLAGAGAVLRHRNTWLLGTYAFVSIGIIAAMQGLWTVPYLRDVYGTSRQAASNLLTLWAVGLIIGNPLWGYLADRVVRSRRRVLLASVLLHAPVWAVLIARPSGLPLLLVGALIVWGGFTNGCWIPAYAQLKDSLPASVAGTSVGFLNFAFFAGAAAYQQVTGGLLDLSGVTADPAGAYRGMFALFFASALVAAAAVWLSSDAHPHRRGPASVPATAGER